MLPLYTVTIFLGAGLLFLVQPMIAKRLLPLLGGSPAVWNTCMVFFQAALLLGYGYAHGLAKWLPARRGAIVHSVVLLVSVGAMAVQALSIGGDAAPVGLRGAGEPPAVGSPILWMLAALAMGVGLPFTIVATGGPILQRWFAATGHRTAGDPYFLYAASNAGSLLALLGYPLAVEPLLRLRTQEWVWSAGYALFAVLVSVCAWRTFVRPPPPAPARQRRRAPSRAGPPSHAPAPSRAHAPLTAARRLRWILLAFVPSSLLLGVTQYVSTDVAAVPLLWVIPLSIYLLTFILAFGSRRSAGPRLMGRAMAVLATGLTAVMFFEGIYPFVAQASPISLILLMHGLALFLGAMVCHGRLAADRPDTADLTEFYLLISVGGVLGGAFNALVAPLLFHDVYEYPIAIVLACLLIPPEPGRVRTRLTRALDVALPLGVGGVLLGFQDILGAVERALSIQILAGWLFPVVVLTVIIIPAAFSLLRPVRLGLVLGAAFVALALIPAKRQAIEVKHRTFFGVYRVSSMDNDRWRYMIHGTTTHGIQAIPDRVWYKSGESHIDVSRLATSYYYHTGPLGNVIVYKNRKSQAGGEPFDHVAVVGLGAGAIAAYALPGQTFTFYDIEPFVVEVAQDPRYFTYLRDAATPRGDPPASAAINTVIGDGRLELAKEPDGRFDLIVLDAFSSDAIPVHLITREAVEMYTRKLAPGGLLAFHVSNRYLHLPHVLGAIAGDLGMLPAMCDETGRDITEEEARLKKQASTWVVLARTPDDLAPDLGHWGRTPPYRWTVYQAPADFPVWTDDYSNIIAAFSRW